MLVLSLENVFFFLLSSVNVTCNFLLKAEHQTGAGWYGDKVKKRGRDYNFMMKSQVLAVLCL